MRGIALLAVGMLTLLLFSNGAVLAAQYDGQHAGNTAQVSENAIQQSDVPKDTQSTNSLVTETKVVGEKDGLTLVTAATRFANASSGDLMLSTAAASPGRLSSSRAAAAAPGGNYQFTGYKWDLSKRPWGVYYIVNPSGAMTGYGLSQKGVMTAVRNAVETWNTAAGKEVWFHFPSDDRTARVGTSGADFRNVITWGPLPTGQVAMSYMWMDKATGRHADCDLVFNTNYRWGIDPDGEGPQQLSNALDIQDIATHEIGHWMGLGDLYDQYSSTETMYGIVSLGETQKISLSPGDVAGARALYR